MNPYDLFAEILDYPTPLLSERLKECLSILSPVNREATFLLSEFQAFFERSPLTRMEEIYARTFDLQTACYPCIGYHLFGEDSRRKIFMAGLEEYYQACGFPTGNPLPDRLTIFLRFLAKERDEEEREELIDLCLLPALEHMVKGFEQKDNPYREVLDALRVALRGGNSWASQGG